LFAVLLLASACGGPPTEALEEAERALLGADLAKLCNEESYLAAQRLLEEAKAASEKGDYDDAKRKAIAASQLAEQARLDAEAGREECERRLAAKDKIENTLDTPVVSVPKETSQDPELTLETVYFDFDEAAITESSRVVLDKNARWLGANPSTRIRILGHTDERGSTEYNMALSDKRAQSVKRYLQTVGIEPNRLASVPYGEEKPASFGSSERDHALNRRVEFEVASK
jgi:peptidoglycan-associated lipoprotein